MIPQHIYDLCKSGDTVSSLLAADPALAPEAAVKKLYHSNTAHTGGKLPPVEVGPTREPLTDADLQHAFECGKWGNTRPSDLFLKIYHDALCALGHDSMGGVVSPPLMGSSGVVPLSIYSSIVDNARHMANLIARAEKEVILATNFWAYSDTSTLITNGIRELSKRMGERGERAVVKVIFDRGSVKQVMDNHQILPPSAYTGGAVKLPAPEEIPNVDMQVMNYHRPVLGTFHAKFMVVDRKIAIVCSCNIQENDNVEMQCHLEGPIVDSIYDMALITWHKAVEPPLPSRTTPAAEGGLHSFEHVKHTEMFHADGTIKGYKYDNSTRSPIHEGATVCYNAPAKDKPVQVVELNRLSMQDGQNGQNGQVGNAAGMEGTAHSSKPPVSTNATVLPDHPGNAHEGGASGDHLSSGEPIPEHTTHDPHYDPDIASEVARVQASVSPSSHETRMQAVTRHLNTTIQPETKGDAPECPPHEEMTPYIPHPVHEPFPIALVNRKPYGTLNHGDVYTPQNEAWLSAIRNAESAIFIQSPDINAEPLIPALLAAVRRGIEVTCYACLGYNDAGELLPMQGGTNEMIYHKMYAALKPEQKKNLRCAFYVGKDMTKPINNKFKKRSCHVKLMIVDHRIGIQGSGNQDTQSWFHSQEINILLESTAVCGAWEDAIRRNSNTHIYGWVSQEDGVWRDPEGNEAEGSIGVNPGKFSWATGIIGAVNRVRGMYMDKYLGKQSGVIGRKAK